DRSHTNKILARSPPPSVALQQGFTHGHQLRGRFVEFGLPGRVRGTNALEASFGHRRREAIEKSCQLLVQHTLYRVHQRHLPYALDTKHVLTSCQGPEIPHAVCDGEST